jgi:hypothetical protein
VGRYSALTCLLFLGPAARGRRNILSGSPKEDLFHHGVFGVNVVPGSAPCLPVCVRAKAVRARQPLARNVAAR